ncbi:hypothetical protein LWI29_000359 [Acer saccharum]|uniref:WRKY domain-containing protein n=1 Tax=Acer saccharum TaxID=4024 RepID=A0AA39V821_ACESA|nr:hypothetical protein LWI29_000359 [Acer saccharum]
MSNAYFAPQDSPESDHTEQHTNFELSDYFTFNDWFEEEPSSVIFESVHNPVYRANQVIESGGTGNSLEVPSNNKSEIEILDDGYKWRKYGKKLVRTAPIQGTIINALLKDVL